MNKIIILSAKTRKGENVLSRWGKEWMIVATACVSGSFSNGKDFVLLQSVKLINKDFDMRWVALRNDLNFEIGDIQ
jgi:hypothetical protein